ncbi:DUF58 domain-containing protein [Hymenobacter sp. UYCo722]|uniref:DUF58 domain-containing protein n=1 Tax=Hymenobacter sp. UYCo722 TaxID=3156335 RepID=UPI003392D85C
MELTELIQSIQKFELVCEKLTRQQLAGLFNSTFHGRGWAIDHIRRYEPGDNVRDIEWNVTARLRETFVKTFTQEKERLVWILIDVSRSMMVQAPGRGKYEVAAEVAAAIAFSALESQDQVGVILYSDRIERLIPAARGRLHFWRIARELVGVRPQGKATDTAGALETLLRHKTKSSLVFLLSDFIGDDYEAPSRVLAHQHELIALRINDESEQRAPRLGWMRVQDAESGSARWLNTSAASFQAKRQQQYQKVADRFRQAYHDTNTRQLTLGIQGNYREELITFLQHRR